MRLLPIRALLAAPLALLLVGAGGDAPAPPDPATLAADALGSATVQATVTVLDAGSGPRQVLRFHPRPGATATVEQVQSATVAMSMTPPGGKKMDLPAPAPPTSVTRIRNTVQPTTPAGFVPVKVDFLSATVKPGGSPEADAATAKALESFAGLTFTILVDGEGRSVQTDVGGGDPAMAGAMQSLADQMTMALRGFPDEPVGVGARWRVTCAMGVMGMRFDVTEDLTLTALDAHGYDTAVEMKMAVAEGATTLPGMPPGASVDLHGFAGSGGGKLHVDLDTLASTGTMAMDFGGDMAVGAPGGGGTIAMTMKMHQETAIRAVE